MWNPTETLIANLEEKIPVWSDLYIPKDKAYRYLKHITAQDFADDIEAWKRWFEEAENPIPNFGKQFIDKSED